MLKKLKLLPAIALLAINACSFANKSTVLVPINSNPPGATVFIDGKNFGQTPAFAELTPNKNYKATISKQGYGSANIDMETWYSLRGMDNDDGKRCAADVAALIVPYFVVLMFAPEKCASFKQGDYFVDLAGGRPIRAEENTSLMNGQINNGYNQQQNVQNQMNNVYGGQQQNGQNQMNNGYIQPQPQRQYQNYYQSY